MYVKYYMIIISLFFLCFLSGMIQSIHYTLLYGPICYPNSSLSHLSALHPSPLSPLLSLCSLSDNEIILTWQMTPLTSLPAILLVSYCKPILLSAKTHLLFLINILSLISIKLVTNSSMWPLGKGFDDHLMDWKFKSMQFTPHSICRLMLQSLWDTNRIMKPYILINCACLSLRALLSASPTSTQPFPSAYLE